MLTVAEFLASIMVAVDHDSSSSCKCVQRTCVLHYEQATGSCTLISITKRVTICGRPGPDLVSRWVHMQVHVAQKVHVGCVTSTPSLTWRSKRDHHAYALRSGAGARLCYEHMSVSMAALAVVLRQLATT